MPNATNYSESGIINHFFRSATFPKPSTIAIALTTNIPTDATTDATTGANLQEISNANNYARVNLGPPSDSVWTAVSQSFGTGLSTNTNVISFNQCTGSDWGWVSGLVLTDHATYGSGNILFKSSIVPQFIQVGSNIVFDAGSISLKVH